MYCCEKCDTAFVEALLSYKADANIQDNLGRTALFYAMGCAKDNREIIDVLIQNSMIVKQMPILILLRKMG